MKYTFIYIYKNHVYFPVCSFGEIPTQQAVIELCSFRRNRVTSEFLYCASAANKNSIEFPEGMYVVKTMVNGFIRNREINPEEFYIN